jgi:putative nucleotidyltransferase with HDIG domain
MAGDKVELILSRIRTLPTLPTIIYKLLRLIESPTSTATELSETISKDQALTARVLKLVNSSFYALRSEVLKVSHATTLLGFAAVKNLALGLSVVDMFGRSQEGGLDADAFWEHALGCATCARLIAERVRYVPAEEAFVAGLLHDIGKLILNDYFHTELDSALQLARDEMLPLPRAEHRIFRTDHAEVGAELACHWSLPRKLWSSIRGHHAYREGDTLTNIIYLSNLLTKVKQIGSGGDDVLEPADDRVWAAVGIDEPSLLRILGVLRAEIRLARVFLGLGSPPKGTRPAHAAAREAPEGQRLTKRVLIVEQEQPPISLVELVLLDHAHTTDRTTDPLDRAAEAADLVLLDFPADRLEHARAVRAQIEARTDHNVPVALLPVPRRVSDIVAATEAASSTTRA